MPRKPTGPRVWMKMPLKKNKPPIPTALKDNVTRQAQDLVDTVLKPRYVHDPPTDPQFNYIVDVFIHWYHSYLYFCATYCSPGPDAFSPSFEVRFARLEFAGQEHFHLAFMRHTGEWIAPYEDLPLDEGLNTIRDDPFFQV